MTQQQTDEQEQRFSGLLEGEYDCSRPRCGQLCRATTLAIDEKEVIVDLGGKRDGVVRRIAPELLEDAYRDNLAVEACVPVCVMRVSGPQGELVATGVE